jgi:hypothetical protein
MKAYLSARQVVQRLNGAISVKLVYQLIQAGKLRANRATGKILIEEESLEQLMADPVEPTTPSEPPPPVRRRGRPKKQVASIELW